MALTLGRTRLRLHPLALLTPVAAAMLGPKRAVLALMISLAVHEGAHLLAARALGVGIRQLDLMPFGGAIRMENPYALAPAKLLAVAAAGPAGNLAALVTAAALAHWRVLSGGMALELIRVNLTLMLFNLLPALPLDGGRMLWAVLSERLGRERAVSVGLLAGRVVAALLLALAFLQAIAARRLNLSPAFAAIFVLASAGDERDALSDARLRACLGELRPIQTPVPARLWAVGGDCPARRALRVARADAITVYAVYENSRLTSLTDDRRLLQAILERGGPITIDEALQ